MFENVNQIVRTIHLYPFSQRQISEALVEIEKNPKAREIRICVKPDPAAEYRKVVGQLRRLFGDRWQDNGFFRTFLMVSRTPIMTESHIGHLARTYFPFHRARIEAAQSKVNPPGMIWKC